ncbi:MAG: hypothetical protein AVDCRST_MAG54-149, partial [uncultured Actinomycetospora sp.]
WRSSRWTGRATGAPPSGASASRARHPGGCSGCGAGWTARAWSSSCSHVPPRDPSSPASTSPSACRRGSPASRGAPTSRPCGTSSPARGRAGWRRAGRRSGGAGRVPAR